MVREAGDEDDDGAARFTRALQAVADRGLGAAGAVRNLRPLTAGANKGTWAFEVDTGRGPGRFIVQVAAASGAPDPDAEDDWVPHLDGMQEFQVMQVAQAAGVPVPNVRCLLAPDDGIGLGAVTDHVDGETLGVRILRQPEFAAARAHMTAQCARILAAIHRMPTDALPFLRRFGADETLALYRRVLDAFDTPLPALELALRWGRERRPRVERRAMVHGDFRTGNFIVGPEGIRAVLDWEIAHVGDPLEDLGYLCMRTWRFGGAGPVGGFGRRADLYQAYESASGVQVDPAEVRFWEVMGSMRWALGCVRRAHSFRHQDRRALEFAGVGRRLEEPVHDILALIDGRDD